MTEDLIDLEEIYNYDLTGLPNLSNCSECEMAMFSYRSFCKLKRPDRRNSAECKKMRKSQIEKNETAKREILAAIKREFENSCSDRLFHGLWERE